MLVLSRKERQRIKLGESIVVTVVRVSGDRVRLGIDAPSDVLVLRGELEGDAGVAAPTADGSQADSGQADLPERRVELEVVDAA